VTRQGQKGIITFYYLRKGVEVFMVGRQKGLTAEMAYKSGDKFSHLLLLIALGAQTMIVELTIPRILAPAFGNTLFCWTAIIAVVLVALTLGYHIGGRLAEKQNAGNLTLLLGAVSAIWVLCLSFLGARVMPSLSPLGIMVGPLVASIILAAFPTGCGAAVVPMVVEVIPEGPGKAAGGCYAWSTVGSVIGVLLTGYVLLPQLGVSGSLLTGASLVFVVLILRGKRALGLFCLVAVVLSGTILKQKDSDVIVDKSNGYHRIKIFRFPSDPRVRALFLDSHMHGAVKLGNSMPVLSYHKKLPLIAQAVPEVSNILFIGGGSFSMPRYARLLYPKAGVDVIEIDPDVVKLAHRYLELPDDLNVYVGDGRRFINDHNKTYDLIVHDAFLGFINIPFHLITKEFNQLVNKRLTYQGLLAINVVGHPVESRLVSMVTSTLMEEFKHVSYLAEPNPRNPNLQNLWILASRSPITVGTKAQIEMGKKDFLTDNHAPIEYLIAAEYLMSNY
jgi:spermidine synthase